jgi:hypothetical protein
MKRAWRSLTIAIGASAILLAMLAVVPAYAAFHLWQFDEVFSNADGSVQFIEMFGASDFQNLVGGQQLKSNSNTLTLPAAPGGNLPSTATANHHLLFATAGFSALAGGVTPDYLIPAHFFNPAGDTLNWAGPLFDTKTFGAVPTDGIHSLLIPADTSATNSPTNFAGSSGSVNLVPPPPIGDYNGNDIVDAADYTVWRDTLGQSVIAGQGADGNGNGKIDTGDYGVWQTNFGHAAGSGSFAHGAVPEPSPFLLLVLALVGLGMLRKTCPAMRHTQVLNP